MHKYAGHSLNAQQTVENEANVKPDDRAGPGSVLRYRVARAITLVGDSTHMRFIHGRMNREHQAGFTQFPGYWQTILGSR
jgi:hypothetical protein